MFSILMFFFIIMCIFLAFLIFMQQGKGDMGLGSMGGGTQTLFGGSGGQNFFEKLTWALGALFILGSLGLSLLKSQELMSTRLKGYVLQENKSSEKILIDEGAEAVLPEGLEAEGDES